MKYNVTPRLNQILKEKGITQSELSEMTGVSQAVISRFDRNKQHIDAHLVAISKALNLSCIDELFVIKEISDQKQKTTQNK